METASATTLPCVPPTNLMSKAYLQDLVSHEEGVIKAAVHRMKAMNSAEKHVEDVRTMS